MRGNIKEILICLTTTIALVFGILFLIPPIEKTKADIVPVVKQEVLESNVSTIGVDPALMEYCSQQIAAQHIKNGLKTREQLQALNLNGRPYEILDEHVKKIEEAKRKAAAKVRVVRAIVPYRGGGAEQWRSLVAKYFRADRVDAALYVIQGESGGNPNARNASGASGLFQQMERYWAKRLAAAEKLFGKDFNDNIFDPEANIAVSAMLSNYGTNWSHWVVKPPY